MARNGTDYLIQVNTGTIAVPVWTTVAEQRDASLSRSADTIDYSSKDSAHWQGAAGRRETEISFDALVPTGANAGFDALIAAWQNGTLIQVQRRIAGVNKDYASAIVTTMDEEYPDQGEVTFSATLKVTGTWTAA